jgi:hypothetical protein
MTARLGSCERLLIRLSVMPSLRYSVLGSLLALTNGNTATDEISWVLLPLRNKNAATPIEASSNTAASDANHTFRLCHLEGGLSPATASILVELEFRRRRLRSASISPAP